MASKPEFTTTGNQHKDYWLVNGSRDFSIFPAGIIESITNDIPIHLKVGNKFYGEMHIRNSHARWYKEKGFNCAAELIHTKLSHTGTIYCTESQSKIKIMMMLNPSALLLLEHRVSPHHHFSVTTIYIARSKLDGEIIGRYPGRKT